jgi:hypothetical protein
MRSGNDWRNVKKSSRYWFEPERRLRGMIDEVVETGCSICTIEFQIQFKVDRYGNAQPVDRLKCLASPVQNLFQYLRSMKVLFRYDLERAITVEVQLSFRVNTGCPAERQIERPIGPHVNKQKHFEYGKEAYSGSMELVNKAGGIVACSGCTL